MIQTERKNLNEQCGTINMKVKLEEAETNTITPETLNHILTVKLGLCDWKVTIETGIGEEDFVLIGTHTYSGKQVFITHGLENDSIDRNLDIERLFFHVEQFKKLHDTFNAIFVR